MSDFESAFSVETLNSVLDSVVDGHLDIIEERPRIVAGSDRIEIEHFLRDRALHLPAISRKVLSGRFTFGPFLERTIPKPGSKETRTISIASIRDSVAQRALYEYLYAAVDSRLSPSVFGYRKGCSAHDAGRLIKRHFNEGRMFVFDADLTKFFDNVDHSVLAEFVADLQLDDRAATLIRRFLKTGKIPAAQVDEHRAASGNQRKYVAQRRTVGVPQGGVLSGLLSNLYLAKFDAEIREHQPGYVRYADDFLVCCVSDGQCREVEKLVKAALAPLRVCLNEKKTRTSVLANAGVDFLGFRVSTTTIRVRGRNREIQGSDQRCPRHPEDQRQTGEDTSLANLAGDF